MARHRFFIDSLSTKNNSSANVGGSTNLDSLVLNKDTEVYHRIANVLKLKVGEELEIVRRDDWTTWLCEIESLCAQQLKLCYLAQIEKSTLPFQLTLVLGFSKGDTNERVVRQTTELGISRIMPTIFARSISRPNEKRAVGKIERLRKIATSAAQQAHRSDMPAVEDLQILSRGVDFMQELKPDLVLISWEEESDQTISTAIAATNLPNETHVVIVIGPEGGIDAEEIELMHSLRNSGIEVCTVSLGPTILGVDTAACAAVSIAHNALRLQGAD